jgi:uncharacterized protein
MRSYDHMVLAAVAALCLASTAQAEMQIAEVLADPPNDVSGDVNHDGTRSAIEDEFVELLNTGTSPIDLSGWTLSDAVQVRHTFATGTSLVPGASIVIFGGGTPRGFDTAIAVASSGTLSLNNHGDVVTLRDASLVIMDTVAFGSHADRDQSLVRRGPNALVLHTSIESAEHAPYSPGIQ